MKKVLSVVLLGLTICLTGCFFNTVETTTKEPNIHHSYDVTEVITALTTVASEAEKGCIGIYNRTTDGKQATGSGVIFKKESAPNDYTRYYAITNYHVINGHKFIKAFLGRDKYGDQYVDANFLGGSEKDDLAIISFNTKKELNVIEIGTNDIVKKGEFVVAIGCPLGLTLFNTVTTGVVSNLSSGEIQHDAAINPGNSGGGLFNLQGRLIGINSSKASTTGETTVEGIGFAIDVTVINTIIDQVLNDKKPADKVTLGISAIEYNTFLINASQEELAKLPNNLLGGVVVYEVVPSSNAHLAGLKQYDVITSINETEINTLDDLSKILGQIKTGDTITINVNRNGAINEIQVTVK